MKIALITGGSSGLGFAIAKLLGQKGYFVIILARNIQKINSEIEHLKQLNIEATGYSCDITKEDDLKKVSQEIKNQYGKIDFLILSAGVVTVKLVSDYENVTELKNDLEIDLWGTIQSTYFFNSLLVEQSKVLFISSAFGIMGAAGYPMYCAAKAGVLNFAEAYRREVQNRGISVYVATPGDIDTPQYRGEIESHPAWMKKSTPRKVDSAESVAKKILKKCKGKYQFLIIPAGDAKLLYILTKILPRKFRDFLLDNIFPQPPAE